VVDADTAASYEQMYSPDADSIGRMRTADTDWAMFGFYIRNNVTVSFQCFAGGLSMPRVARAKPRALATMTPSTPTSSPS